ncbi:Arc family DNA-binding protein [Sinorhizobium medicae]|nr:Arc family DNA-binding protein [Sinorhizobium medicae]
MNEDAEEVRLTLRLPASLRDRLTKEASISGRSLNAEMVFRLEISADVERVLKDFELAKERILSAQRIEEAQRKQVEILTEALELERATNDKLLGMLGSKMGAGKEA